MTAKAIDKSQWVKWLVSESVSAQETLAFLESAYLNLTADEQSRWARRISSGDEQQVMGTVYELVAIELLRRRQLAPRYAPKIKGKTPDILFTFAGKEYLADVYLAHSPKKTYQMTGARSWTSRNAGDRARELAEEISRKATKYDKLGMPIIIFVFIGDHFGLKIKDIEEALLGYFHDRQSFTKSDVVNMNQVYPLDVSGLYLRKILGRPYPKHLTAVVACDWYDSRDSRAPGKYLHCLVIHHWDTKCALPIKAFRRFPQIVWSRKGPHAWKWRVTPNLAVIAKLPVGAGMQFFIKN